MRNIRNLPWYANRYLYYGGRMTNQWYDEDGETYARYRDKPKFTGRGGYRGGGRKPTEAAGYTATIWARVSDDDKEKYLALGGSDFLRKAIREAYAAKGGSRVDSN